MHFTIPTNVMSLLRRQGFSPLLSFSLGMQPGAMTRLHWSQLSCVSTSANVPLLPVTTDRHYYNTAQCEHVYKIHLSAHKHKMQHDYDYIALYPTETPYRMKAGEETALETHNSTVNGAASTTRAQKTWPHPHAQQA